jgi:hypothetical protein
MGIWWGRGVEVAPVYCEAGIMGYSDANPLRLF